MACGGSGLSQWSSGMKGAAAAGSGRHSTSSIGHSSQPELSEVRRKDKDICRGCRHPASYDKRLFSCDNCGKCYHAACHRPPIQVERESNRWTCRNCVKDQTHGHEVITISDTSSSVASHESSRSRLRNLSPTPNPVVWDSPPKLSNPPNSPPPAATSKDPWKDCISPGCRERIMKSGRLGIDGYFCDAHVRMLNTQSSVELTAVSDQGRRVHNSQQAEVSQSSTGIENPKPGLECGDGTIISGKGSSEQSRLNYKPGEKKPTMKRTSQSFHHPFSKGSPPSAPKGSGFARPVHVPPRSPEAAHEEPFRKRQKLNNGDGEVFEGTSSSAGETGFSRTGENLVASPHNDKVQSGMPPSTGSLPYQATQRQLNQTVRPGLRPDEANGKKKILSGTKFPTPIRKMAAPAVLPIKSSVPSSSTIASQSPSTGSTHFKSLKRNQSGGKDRHNGTTASRREVFALKAPQGESDSTPKPSFISRDFTQSLQRRSEDDLDGSVLSLSSGKGDKSTSAGTEESALTTPEATPQVLPDAEPELDILEIRSIVKPAVNVEVAHPWNERRVQQSLVVEPRKPKRNVDVDLLDSLIYRQEGASKPPPKVKAKLDRKLKEQSQTPAPQADVQHRQRKPHFGYIDPRIHWPQRHSAAWYQAKLEEIQARGGRKTRLGKAVESLQKLRSQESSLTFEDTLPEMIQNDPEWVRFLRKLHQRDDEPSTPVPKKRGKPGPKPKKLQPDPAGL